MRKLVVSIFILLFFDFIYIRIVSSHFTSLIHTVQKSPLKLNGFGAVGAYLFLILGLYYFIIRTRRSVLDAFLLGFTIYGVYAMTTLALFRDWRVATAFMDTLWGGTLYAITTYLTYKLT
jgi:uncharacterized membrane protein